MAVNFPARRNATIDLLPESIQKRRQLRNLVIRLATVQVAIFLCIVLMFIGINALEQRAWERVTEINRQVYALRHGPEVAAVAYAHDITQRLAIEDALLQAHAPANFDPEWLTAIMQASGKEMTVLYYNNTAITITGISYDITAVEAHRQSIRDTGLFNYVELGRIILQDCGRYFYELHVRV